jgi:hypothetical protein
MERTPREISRPQKHLAAEGGESEPRTTPPFKDEYHD